MLVYVLPLVALLLGAAVIARAARRWTATGDSKVQQQVERETAEM
jgi:hypothetical protein